MFLFTIQNGLIILTENKLPFEPNKRIGQYITDFYIPDLKVCLEIDGHLHNYSTKKDCARDITIRNILGKDWEVVRIKTKYIEKDPENIVPSIINEKMLLQNLRLQNGGIIPESYAKRFRDYYESIGEYRTKKYYIQIQKSLSNKIGSFYYVINYTR